MFPKWGIAEGHEAIGRMFADVGATLKSIKHHYAEFTWIFSGGDLVVAEGTSYGEHIDGPCRAGVSDWAAGRWCDVFEIRDPSRVAPVDPLLGGCRVRHGIGNPTLRTPRTGVHLHREGTGTRTSSLLNRPLATGNERCPFRRSPGRGR